MRPASPPVRDGWASGAPKAAPTRYRRWATPVWLTFHHEPLRTSPTFPSSSPNALTGDNYDWAQRFGAPGAPDFDLLGYDAYPGREKTVQPEWEVWVPEQVAISEDYGLPFAGRALVKPGRAEGQDLRAHAGRSRQPRPAA